MKKVFKGFLAIGLMLVVALPVLLFSGCTKNFNINITIKTGMGQVYLKGASGSKVEGKNTVKEGSKFEFQIEALTSGAAGHGYQIDKIVIDGEEQVFTEVTTKVYKFFDNIKSNHTVDIYFKRQTATLTFMYWNGSQYAKYTSLDVLSDTALDFNEAKYGGQGNTNWFKYSDGKKEYLVNGLSDPTEVVEDYISSNHLKVNRTMSIYTDLSKEQLDALFGA